MRTYIVKSSDVIVWAARTGNLSGELETLARLYVLYCMEGKLSPLEQHRVMYAAGAVKVERPPPEDSEAAAQREDDSDNLTQALMREIENA